MIGPTWSRAAVFTLAVAALLALPVSASRLSDPAQTLQYRVAWNGIPAANATVTVTPEVLGGQPAYSVDASAGTNRFVDIFYRFRGFARVLFLADGQIPLQFRFERDEGGRKAMTTIDFSPSNKRARSLYLKGGKKRKELDIDSTGLFDPITAVFKARADPVEIGNTLNYDIFTGEGLYRIELKVIGRQQVEVPAGTFPAIALRPQVWKINKDESLADPRLRNATIWVSDDPDHLLLSIRSEIFIGAITLDLVSRELQS